MEGGGGGRGDMAGKEQAWTILTEVLGILDEERSKVRAYIVKSLIT